MIPQTVPRLSPPLRRSLIQSAVTVALLLPYHNSLPAQQMIFPDAAWQTATPESMLVDSQKLQAAVANLSKTTSSVHEMLITRNGRVIWEGTNACDTAVARPEHEEGLDSLRDQGALARFGARDRAVDWTQAHCRTTWEWLS